MSDTAEQQRILQKAITDLRNIAPIAVLETSSINRVISELETLSLNFSPTGLGPIFRTLYGIESRLRHRRKHDQADTIRQVHTELTTIP